MARYAQGPVRTMSCRQFRSRGHDAHQAVVVVVVVVVVVLVLVVGTSNNSSR